MAQAPRRPSSQPAPKRKSKRPRQRVADRPEGAQRVSLLDGSLPLPVRHALGHDDKRGEEALRESEERYRDLFENANDLIQSVAPDGSLIYVNRAWRKALGYSEDEIPALSLFDIIHPDSKAHCMEMFQRVMGGETADRVEAMFVTKDGRTIWVEGSANCRFQEGRPVATRGIFRDITERKQAEEALRESEERLRTVVSNAPVIVWALDSDGVYTLSQGRGLDAIGLKAGEVVGQSLFDLFRRMPPLVRENRPALAGEALHLVAEVGGALLECWYHPLRDENGRFSGATGVAMDITERKKAEEALRESEERYRLLAENATDVIWTMDRNLRFTYVSPSVTRLQGYTVEEALAHSAEEAVTPASLEVAMNALAEELAIEEMEEKDLARTRTLELEHTCKDGSTVWAEVKVTALRDDEDRLVGILGVSRDITERRRAQETLQKAREELEWKVERQMRRGNAYGLTFRELTVLNLVARGKSDREIGIILGISHFTAQKHMANILGKMDAASRTGAGVRALGEGLLD